MILPEVRELTGSDVQVERMSLTFFKTFPRFGVELETFNMPTPDGQQFVSIDELLIGVELRPLLNNELSISRLSINRPIISYSVFADSTTNIDFLLELAAQEPEVDDAEAYAITIPRFTVRDAEIFYSDELTSTILTMRDFDADISLNYAELIESTIDATLGSLSAEIDGVSYVENLSLSLNQTSTLDLENEILNLTEGIFSIRGLALNLSGSISSWSSEAPEVDLQFISNSDNFGDLLRLVPPEYEDAIAGLQTRGSLALEGSVTGQITENKIPRFDLVIQVTDGFVQNPDLPDAIENIMINIEVNNDLATIREFRATAAENSISATGSLERPLEEDAVFSVEINGDVDLATMSRFYPIEEFGIENLAGMLQTNSSATGRIDQPEEAIFTGTFSLSNGLLKYIDVPRAIEQINAKVDANQDRIIIEESGFTASSNRLTMSGQILRPLDENERSVDLTSNIDFDLATIKDFYPIDEDTLTMRGRLQSQIILRGKPDPENLQALLNQSTIEFRDGYISHHQLGKPLEEITFIANASSSSLTISRAQFKTGENSLSAQGSVENFLSDNPFFDLTFDGNALFDDISSYYSLEPWIQELTGNAVMNLNAKGPAGDPTELALNGSLQVDNVNAIGDSIPLPVTDLSGELNITPNRMTLNRFTMMYGTSDIGLEGTLDRYLNFLNEAHETTSTMPSISGSYRSNFLNIDEMIDWDAEAEDVPIPIELPNMIASVSARIDSLVIFDMAITQITGSAIMNPDGIIFNEASATMFGGTANGKMDWMVPDPLRTNLRFEGALQNLRADVFFRDTGFLGENSKIHEYVTGQFSADINYFTELDETITPDIVTTDANGSFGMDRANLSGHPIQMTLSRFLRASELESVNLDEWTANFTIKDAVMTLEDLRLTSDNIGIELNGTQHMVTEEIDFSATLFLPERFKGAIASVISNRAADALQREDGTLAVPVRITGTASDPQVRPDTSVIEDIVRDALRDGAGNVLRNLFNRN